MANETTTASNWADKLLDDLQQLETEIGGRAKLIPDGMSFLDWCQSLAARGLKVDGKPFSLEDRPAMAWIYGRIPSTRAEAFRRTLVLMKCAQVGFTVMEILAVIYLGIKFGPCTAMMYLPDQALADIKSSKRFMPIVRSIPDVYALMVQDAADGSGRKQGEGNVRVRQMGDTMYVFSYTTGRASTESIPGDILAYDEVQEMTLEQMEKTNERLSASPVRYKIMGSTANWPEADIHFWYMLGSQHQFHTRCPTCDVLKPLDDYFPDCIRYDDERNAWRYVCQAGHWIDDSQAGEWIAANPDALKGEAPIESIHFPQFLSPTISPGEIMLAYNTATSMKNFFNRKRGRPFLDPSQVPVTLEHLERCVQAGKVAGIKWKTRSVSSYMGIDQMGNYNVVVIKERLADGRQAVIHLEEIYSDDPFARCDELMEAYGVAVCCLEINPNYNEAKRFANRHRRRVFIGNSFGKVDDGMVHWGDAPKLDVSERRTDENERDRYVFRMDQYKCMQVSMARFTAAEPICLFPDPQGLVQEVIDKKVKQMAAVLPRAFHHFTKTALIAEKEEETNKFKRVVKKIGIDPHFSYANMLCDVAWARAHGTGTFIMPETNVHTPITDKNVTPAAIVEAKLPGFDNRIEGAFCGNCMEFDKARGYCKLRSFSVQASLPGCEVHAHKDNP